MTNHDARGYAIGHLTDVRMGPAIVEYLERIDATLEPYGGRFIIHGDRPTVYEGAWTGDLIVIEFPDRASAESWYFSREYQAILALRADNADGTIMIVDGVGSDHVATDVLGADEPTPPMALQG